MKNLFYSFIRKKQDNLKRRTDRRYEGLWMGPPPKLLDENELLPGDVIFCGQSKKDKATELIQNTTDGVYVHCAIYVGDGKIVDAVRSGVREIELRSFLSEYAYLAVTRPPGANPKRSNIIVDFARECVEREFRYNLWGAAFVPIREYFNVKSFHSLDFRKRRGPKKISRAWLPKKSYFCSELVIECYVKCGYIGEDYSYFRSSLWSPTGLAEEAVFQLKGFMSTGGLAAVDPLDPYIGGCDWVLTPRGRRQLEERQRRLEARARELNKAHNNEI